MRRSLLVSVVVMAGLALLNVGQYFAWFEPGQRSRTEIIDSFVELWSREVAFFLGNKWLGIQTLQHPLDAWVTQEILWELKPDFVVETGTRRGGSALLWATVLEQGNPSGRVITVDIKDEVQEASRHPLWERKIEFLKGSSTAPGIVAAIAQRVRGKRVVVILDSLHTREHVLDELKLYSPFVPMGSYLFVQDTSAWSEDSRTGAGQAVLDFLNMTDAFESDRSRERFLLTGNATGFLERVK